MKKISKNIFGKNYVFFVGGEFEGVLTESINSYHDSMTDSTDVDVFVGSINANDILVSRNPSVFFRYENSFSTDFGSILINWSISEDRHLVIHLSFPKDPAWRRQLRKLRSMEYSTDAEIFEQILHELVLIPSTYFFTDLVPVHSAAFSINGKGILLAGTGGTGKTSAVLALRNEKEVSFLSDDIAVLTSDGLIYPNLAWPKIYGYNINNTNIKQDLLAGRGVVDKLHFHLRYKIDPTKVRRKIRPDALYGNVGHTGSSLSQVYLLFREDAVKMEIREISSNAAAEMCVAVMQTEYAVFHKFIYWEMFNALATGGEPLLDMAKVIQQWSLHLRSVFSRAQVNLISIPLSISHEKYLDEIRKIILK